MEYEVIKIDEHTWRIEEEGVRFFLLEGKDKALLIDSGMKTHNAKEIAKSLTRLPVELLNTHADIDHIGSNDEFIRFYMNPADASNFYNTQKRVGIFIPVNDGDVLDLGDRELEIIAIPGHTPGSIAVLDRSRGVMYSGDSIQSGQIFMFGVQREIHAYIHSLKKLDKYRERYDIIYPCHGRFPVSPSLIPQLIQAAETVMKKAAEGKEMTLFGDSVMVY
ncbi:MAG: MBL fold metallo-hydrolase, partial [Spirochaetales bacterium]|nr:MBL fold metallo-hydrolase [Candidatus Physcosoma equi]